ncbi:MAG: hypothetical protein L0G22_12070, partial [Propionibacteriaceae bacterium]|nr:hypothetical protein [Propionibacteriaceae bacterium]
PLAAVHPVHQVPHVAEITLGCLVATLVLVTDLRGVIGFSSFGVLLYYFVANRSAWTQTGADRRYPRALQGAGMALCLLLVATLPWTSVAAGVAVFLVGATYRLLRRRPRPRRRRRGGP